MLTAISRRKIDMPVDKVIAAINALDLKLVSLENVEILQRMVPTDQEVIFLYTSFYGFNYYMQKNFIFGFS